MKMVPPRLRPRGDLHLSLEAWMARQKEQAGSDVRTTAELVVGVLPEWQFRRAATA